MYRAAHRDYQYQAQASEFVQKGFTTPYYKEDVVKIKAAASDWLVWYPLRVRGRQLIAAFAVNKNYDAEAH